MQRLKTTEDPRESWQGAVMESLSSLIRDAASGDPLARSMEAVLDSGLVLFTRDSAGRFVQISPVLHERLGMGDARGAREPGDTKTYDANGRALSGIEYPGTVTQTSGEPQREVLLRLERGDGLLWLQISTMPLERTPDGWNVLTIGADVTELVEDRDSALRAASVRGTIAELAMELAGRSVEPEELAELLRESVAKLLPRANVVLATQCVDQYRLETVHHGFGERPSNHGGRITEEIREELGSGQTLVKLDVQDTDILGARVAVEYGNPIRSMVVAASGRADGSRLAGLVATSDRRQAFDRLEIESLELLGRLVGSVLAPETGDSEGVVRRSA